jgi:hypothetical protein
MNTYWFKPRDKGYGATPVTWEGWVVTVAAMVVVVMSSLLVPLLADGTYWGLAALVIDVLVIVALLIVSKRKTDGEWRWRWRKS